MRLELLQWCKGLNPHPQIGVPQPRHEVDIDSQDDENCLAQGRHIQHGIQQPTQLVYRLPFSCTGPSSGSFHCTIKTNMIIKLLISHQHIITSPFL